MLLGLSLAGYAQTSPTQPPATQPPAAGSPAGLPRVDRSLRCDDTRNIQTAREESRAQRTQQRFEYQAQRNAEIIQRANFTCSRTSERRQAACQASVAARERRLAEQLEVARQREDAYHQEMLRRIDAAAEVCRSRYSGVGAPADPNGPPADPNVPPADPNQPAGVEPIAPADPAATGDAAPGAGQPQPAPPTTGGGIQGAIGKAQAVTSGVSQGIQIIGGIKGMFKKR
jgi:hypothetical protein